jgi:hypothetical protein
LFPSAIIERGPRITNAQPNLIVENQPMVDIWSKLNSEDIVGMFALLCCLIFGLSTTVVVCWYKFHKNNIAAALKQDMLNRGMSAEDIKTVLEAGTKRPAVMEFGCKE